MNTQLSIKTRRLLFSPIFVRLLIGVAVLILGGSAAQAQTTTAPPPPAPAPAIVDSSITIVTKGTVNDPNGAITFSGNVIVNCRRVVDTTGTSTAAPAPPVVLLDLDFSNLSGTSGSVKTLRSYTTGGNHATEIRPLQASDTIIVTSPYIESTTSAVSAKSMLVTATLNFDISTGTVTGGSITIGNNVVTSAMVGTVTPAN
jgi:hypothetical protein